MKIVESVNFYLVGAKLPSTPGICVFPGLFALMRGLLSNSLKMVISGRDQRTRSYSAPVIMVITVMVMVTASVTVTGTTCGFGGVVFVVFVSVIVVVVVAAAV